MLEEALCAHCMLESLVYIYMNTKCMARSKYSALYYFSRTNISNKIYKIIFLILCVVGTERCGASYLYL